MNYECVDTGKGPWCATSVNEKDLIKTWAYCLPEGIETYKQLENTKADEHEEETYNSIFAEKIKR